MINILSGQFLNGGRAIALWYINMVILLYCVRQFAHTTCSNPRCQAP